MEKILTEDEIESYVSGKCMFLASALRRAFGWEIQVALEHPPNDDVPYIGHAWCVEPKSGMCVDIDGLYPHDISGWIHPGATLMKDMDEDALRELTLNTGYCTFTLEQWEASVEEAQAVVASYLGPKLSAAMS